MKKKKSDLAQLEPLVGKWSVELSNASFLPDPKQTLQTITSFEWIEEGDFLVMRQGRREKGQNYATWIIGCDDPSPNYSVLYSDDRNVRRVYAMSFRDGLLKIWRNSPKFSQRFEGRISKDGKTIKAHWEKSTNGKKWEHDFDLFYKKGK